MYNITLKMIHTTHTLRVRYAETDPMKYAYYGNYAAYLEVARVELFRTIGMSYDDIEKKGIWLPVSEFKIKYLKPALYDQPLEIHTKRKRRLPKRKQPFFSWIQKITKLFGVRNS